MMFADPQDPPEVQYAKFMKLAGPYWMSCVTRNDALPILPPDRAEPTAAMTVGAVGASPPVKSTHAEARVRLGPAGGGARRAECRAGASL